MLLWLFYIFYMYIDICERIAGKQDWPSLAQNLHLFTLLPKLERLVVNCFPLLYTCLQCDEMCIC